MMSVVGGPLPVATNRRQRTTDNGQLTMLIRTGDSVEVIAGNDRGVKSRVIKVDRETGKALVEGVNRVKKHIRRSQKYPQGGVLSKEMPVQLSNLKYVCQSCGAPTRLGARFLEDGSKERFCKKCNASAGQIAPAKKAHATSAPAKTAKTTKAKK
jgi:large subunit ribosomal protein L24